ncbi:hypothetical protein ABH892_004997 [Paenibacillus sp. RC254]|uniref:PD-(D/E)XK nuclease domain-containing protein n=1 Tax=unclassified Paenibacillus TaxID=185978 RepID=UPI0024BBB827|nr:hypothetical protein [Paenibacillus sp. RC334]
MNQEKAAEQLERQKNSINQLQSVARFSPEFKKWYRDTQVVITKIFGEDTRHLKDFLGIRFNLSVFNRTTPDQQFETRYRNGLKEASAILDSFIQEINDYGIEKNRNYSLEDSWITNVKRICDRFHNVSRQLRSRHANRDSLTIEDEYDVQDLFHALLAIYFDDIRAEEWTPSYAGSSSRVDFLLKPEQAVIEIKKTRKGLKSKELGEQLIIDIHKYKAHPSCQYLVCFVYDPEGRIANPRGIEADLKRENDDMEVEVIIRP